MHFPEEQLLTYLRVFLPEDRLSDVLDEIAEAALESEVEDQLVLFAIAHRLMDIDERRTRDLEAAVLVAEVGLPVEDVADILDLSVHQVQDAVALVWAEVEMADVAPEDPAPTASGAPGWRRVPRAWWLGGVTVAALVALATAVFSEAGTARLHAVGLDPFVAFLVVIGLIGGGTALVRAAGTSGSDETPPPIGTPTPGRPLGADAAPRPDSPATAADPSDGPGGPSTR